MKIKGRMKVSYPFFVTLSQKKKNSYVTITILSVGYAYEDLEGMWIWKRKQENEGRHLWKQRVVWHVDVV